MWTAVAAVPSPDLLPGHVLQVPGSLQAFQHHEGTVLAHGRRLHHGLQVHPNPPLCTKQLENLHQTNPCAVKTTNSNKVIKVVFMVSNLLYNIQQHEIK